MVGEAGVSPSNAHQALLCVTDVAAWLGVSRRVAYQWVATGVIPREASRLLGVSELTVRLWADTGRLRAIRDHAGRRLITRESIEQLRRARAAARDPVKPQ